MATYMRERREARRRQLRELLDGKCVDCGAKDNLEFDHKDPDAKSFTIASGLDGDWTALVNEVLKCELRCHECHLEKSQALGQLGSWGEKNGMWVEALHGTAKMYGQGCKCIKCRTWKHLYRNKKVDSRGNEIIPL